MIKKFTVEDWTVMTTEFIKWCERKRVPTQVFMRMWVNIVSCDTLKEAEAKKKELIDEFLRTHY
jgi:hypothetical protein